MTKRERRKIVNEMLVRTRMEMMRIADAAPEHFDGIHMRFALHVVASRFLPGAASDKFYRRRSNELKVFVYNEGL
jgi:hypothetical protein